MPQLSRKRKSVTWRDSVLPRRQLVARALRHQGLTVHHVTMLTGGTPLDVQAAIDGSGRNSRISTALWSIVELTEGPRLADAWLLRRPLGKPA